MTSVINPLRSAIRMLAAASFAAGLFLLSVNVLGLFVSLRSHDVNEYTDFAGVKTLDFETAIKELDGLAAAGSSKAEVAGEATRVVHEAMAHIARSDRETKGLEHYNMSVPITENWILYVLRFLKPDTYTDYEFCSYRRALERGTGRCGQQVLALVSYLDEQGLETGFVSLGGHAVATAKVDESQWYLLDPDYGGVIPFDLATAERNPVSTIPYYWSRVARDNSIHEAYAGPNGIKYGGPEARYARACPIEEVAYVLKWLAPASLLFPLPLILLWWRKPNPSAP